MRYLHISRSPVVSLLILTLGWQFVSACSKPDWHFGHTGKYNEARFELLRRVNGNLDKAIANFAAIANDDPTYRDTLTLLGRAFYKKGRFKDAHVILQRAVAIRQDDEIAWLLFGTTQLRLGDNERGLESVRGGLTLFNKATADHKYRDYDEWDPADKVRNAMRRAVFNALKGLEQKEDLIRSVDAVLVAVEDEEFHQLFEKPLNRRQYS